MALKEDNEITVKINATKKQMLDLFNLKEFELKNIHYLEDFFYVPKTLNIKNMTTREILSNAVLIRDLYNASGDKPVVKNRCLCYKHKVFNDKDEIVSQKKYNVDIQSIEDAKQFLNAIGYVFILNIREYEYQFEKDGLMFELKDVINGDLIMEIETVKNSKFNSIEAIKSYLIKLEFPIDYSNLFVKKAETQLEKIKVDKYIKKV